MPFRATDRQTLKAERADKSLPVRLLSLVYEKAAFSGCIWHGVFKDVSLPSSFDFYAVVEILDCDNQI